MAQALFVRPVEPADAEIWERMRTALWPDESESHSGAISRYFSSERANPLEVFVACSGSGAPLGFIELSIRSHRRDGATDRLAVVEGLYVEPDHRGRDADAALRAAAEEWGRVNQCTEVAFRTRSDSQSHHRG